MYVPKSAYLRLEDMTVTEGLEYRQMQLGEAEWADDSFKLIMTLIFQIGCHDEKRAF